MTLPPGTNRYLDLVQNRQPLIAGQFVNALAALVLAWVDKNVIHFTDPSVDPSGVLTFLAVYVVTGLITTAWAWGKVWSERSHVAEVSQAYSDGMIDGQPQPPARPEA